MAFTLGRTIAPNTRVVCRLIKCGTVTAGQLHDEHEISRWEVESSASGTYAFTLAPNDSFTAVDGGQSFFAIHEHDGTTDSFFVRVLAANGPGPFDPSVLPAFTPVACPTSTPSGGGGSGTETHEQLTDPFDRLLGYIDLSY